MKSFSEAIQQDFFDIALLLIDSGCNVCQTDKLQQAPIHSAVRKGNKQSISIQKTHRKAEMS